MAVCTGHIHCKYSYLLCSQPHFTSNQALSALLRLRVSAQCRLLQVSPSARGTPAILCSSVTAVHLEARILVLAVFEEW
jgi:hypothetical protein